jgi:hypothetical protein
MPSLAHLRWWGSAARPTPAATPATLRGVRDLLVPGSIRELPRSLEVGGRYQATLAIRTYPREVGPN